MNIEWEAKFLNINKDEIRIRLKNAGGILEKPEQLYRRTAFFLPKGHERDGGFARVRDEGDKITMSLKIIKNGDIKTQQEVNLTVDNYDNSRKFLSELGCREKAYQETKRELWKIGDTEITIDEWPYVNAYIEIEGKSEEAVKNASEKLGLDYKEAVFGAADQIISKQYNIPESVINNEISRITFDDPNPYLAWTDKDSTQIQ